MNITNLFRFQLLNFQWTLKFFTFPRIRRKQLLLILFGSFTFCYLFIKFSYFDYESIHGYSAVFSNDGNFTSSTITIIINHYNGSDDNDNNNQTNDEAENFRISASPFHMCPEYPPDLDGKLSNPPQKEANSVDVKKLFAELELANKDILSEGGSWQPKTCKSIQTIALIIPFRDRLSHLALLLGRLHPILQKQLIQYTIYVAEQEGDYEFNKARMLNIAFEYINRTSQGTTDCFIFQDVDLIPETDNNFYRCDDVPRHLSPAVSTLRYRLPYKELIGGVLAMTPALFEQVNGYSNLYWGWGGEDDDMFYRIEAENLTVTRPSRSIGRYTMIKHKKRPPKKGRLQLVWSSKTRYKNDGIAQLSNFNYSIVFVKKKPLYTHMMINVGPPPE